MTNTSQSRQKDSRIQIQHNHYTCDFSQAPVWVETVWLITAEKLVNEPKVTQNSHKLNGCTSVTEVEKDHIHWLQEV